MEYHGAPLRSDLRKPFPAFPARRGKKTLKAKSGCGKPRHNKRRNSRAGSRQRHHGYSPPGTQTHKVLSGVGYAGSPRVGDKRAALSGGKAVGYLCAARRLVMLMI